MSPSKSPTKCSEALPEVHVLMCQKRLEEAEQRRLEGLRKKQASLKMKNDEWKQKVEKIKLEEEKKKEKQEIGQFPSSTASSNVFTKLAQRLFGKRARVEPGGLHPSKPPEVARSAKMPGSSKLPLSKNPFLKALVSSPVIDGGMEDSFEVGVDANTFFEQGHLDTFDITAYEEYDEELKHRKSKALPSWASNSESLKITLFSMILMRDYENKLPGGFPKPDKTYKLFPNTK